HHHAPLVQRGRDHLLHVLRAILQEEAELLLQAHPPLDLRVAKQTPPRSISGFTTAHARQIMLVTKGSEMPCHGALPSPVDSFERNEKATRNRLSHSLPCTEWEGGRHVRNVE